MQQSGPEPFHAESTRPPLLLEIQGLSKSFPGVRALQDVNLKLGHGEVLGLLGENGAGKSTLIKILAGVHRQDSGTILVDGHSIELGTPIASRRAGIGVIHQEFNLVPAMTVSENLFLGQEQSLFGPLSEKQEQRQAAELFSRLGINVPPAAVIRDLTIAQQQLVEIAKPLVSQSKILIMDEPTAALSPREVDALSRVIRDLSHQGIGIIYISHRLDEIYHLCTRATVLRDGQYIGTCSIPETPREKLIEMMVGRTLDQEYPPRTSQPGSVRLSVKSLSRGRAVRNVSFELRSGEILGLTGLVGAGRTEMARLIFGADRRDQGEIFVNGVPLPLRSPREAIASGICLLTEDRKHQGLVLMHSLVENFGLPNLSRNSQWGWLSLKRERQAFEDYVRQLSIKAHSPLQPAGTLSGGNQQKVVLAKWLERDAEILIFDEPTRGIDVGARYEIYELMNRLTQQGKAILMITSDFPEALGMSDRILVMHEGQLTGEITDVHNATQEDLLALAIKSPTGLH